MMRLPRFSYFAPSSIEEAAALLAEHGRHAAIVAGGTDLYPNMKRRQQTPGVVIGLERVAGIGEIAARDDDDGGLDVGAMVTLTSLERSEVVRAAWPAFADAARLVSTPPLRNMGTVGGNLCLDTRCNYYDQGHEWRKAIGFCMKKDGEVCWVAPSSPRCWAVSSSDTAPLLCAIGAEVTLAWHENGAMQTRRIRAHQLFNDDGIHYLDKKHEELLTTVHLPQNDAASPTGWRATYKKLRRRGTFDFPVLGVAVAVRCNDDGTVAEASIVLGAIGSRPHHAKDAGDALIGKPLGDADATSKAAEAATHLARPLDNTDFVHAWRKQMTRVYVTRAIEELAAPRAEPAASEPRT